MKKTWICKRILAIVLCVTLLFGTNVSALAGDTVSGGDAIGNEETIVTEETEEKEDILPELTGNYGEDVAAFALSQIGQAEWNGLFVKSCVSYAKIPTDRFPIADTVADWVQALNSEEYGMYVSVTEGSDEYAACVGDLLFLDKDADGNADCMAVIVEVSEDGTIEAVEEQEGVAVKVSYAADDACVLGYGMIPFNMEGIESDIYDDNNDSDDTVSGNDIVDVDDESEDDESADDESAGDELIVIESSETDDWEATLPLLSGVYADDVVAVANSQLGYTQSADDVSRNEEGEVIGYFSRYGSWNETPYAEWNVLFVKFCLNYANIPTDKFPQADTAAEWIAALQSEEYDLFVPATVSPDEYQPCAGDLIFLNTDEIGIFKSITNNAYQVIQEKDGAVSEVEYAKADASIIGYGMLPINMVDDEGAMYEEETDNIVLEENQSTGHSGSTNIKYPNISFDNNAIDPPEDNEALELNKIINDNNDANDNTFELNLDAYATGDSVEVETVVPMDITLVLDRSGSMVQVGHFLTLDEDDSVEEGNTYYDYNSSTSKNSDKYPKVAGRGIYTGDYASRSNWGLSVARPNPIRYCTCDNCLDPDTGEGKWVKQLTTYFTNGTDSGTDAEQLYEVIGTTAEVNAKLKDGTLKLYETNMQATERALKTYLSTIKAQGEAYGVEHRVAIVYYGGSTSKGFGYCNNTTYNSKDGVPADAYMSLTKEWSEIQWAIKSYANMTYSGNSTPTHLGMLTALNIYDSAWAPSNARAEGRKPMVIVFADGAPGVGKNYYANWGNEALRYAHYLEERLATEEDPDAAIPIHVVGLYDDADASQAPLAVPTTYYGKSNRFFNFLSTNYKVGFHSLDREATYYKTNTSPDVVSGVTNMASSYFHATSSARDLADAFAKVAVSKDTQVSTSVSLNEEAILRDQISEYFEHYCTCDANTATEHTCIKVYTVDWDGKQFVDKEQWKQVYPGNSQDPEVQNITVSIEDKTLDVQGFPYNKFPIIEGKEGGKKLVVTLSVETEAGFWGGNNVPTNEAPTNKTDITGTAIYVNNSAIEAFPVPEANVPLHINIEALDKTIYYGGAITADDLLGEITAGYKTTVGDTQGDPNDTITNLKVTVNADGTLSPVEPWMDDYANLNWTTDSVPLEPEVPNKSGSGEGYTFEVVMTPTKAGAENLSGNTNPTHAALAGTAVAVTGKTVEDTGYKYILLPEVTFEDSVVNFGFIPNDTYYNDTNKVTADGEEVWFIDGNFTAEPESGDDDPQTYPAVSGEKPTLTYTYEIASENKNFVQDTPINVAVTSSILDGAPGDITDITTFKWLCKVENKTSYHDPNEEDITTPHKGSVDAFEFWIHLKEPYELPSAGGPSMYWYMFSGMLLMMAGTLMVYNKKRKEVLRR